ncbi:MAG: PQQ-dependent sugar dehydrogenase [Thermoleophilaceae bacterium]|nr:PQQ-dependent sugar dehydrogenase [Thermoleophilaceae bacterium]
MSRRVSVARARGLLPAILIMGTLMTGCEDDSAPAGAQGLPEPPTLPKPSGMASAFELERIADGLVRPTWVGAAPGDRAALWVLEQPGRVVRLAGGERRTVLDLRKDTRVGAEQGLLGAAFHPDFTRNRRLFVHHSNRRGDTRVIEVRITADGRAKPGTRRVLLALAQPDEDNHKGGALQFGPDGRLYIGLGDGGGAYDTYGNAQNLDSQLGKLLAADVDEPGRPRWDIELYGLRNPWRFWIDPALGEAWIGDVGQDASEEIHRVQIEPDEPPKNLGWPVFEGTTRHRGRRLADPGRLEWPVTEYPHSEGCSVTGGVIYRGRRLRRLSGRYLYGDFCTGTIWSLRPAPKGQVEDIRRERAKLPQLTHIGTDNDGELILASASGELHRATAPKR